MNVVRALVATVVVGSFLPLSAAAATAAPPTSDTRAGARRLALGASVVLDTTEATTDADDVAANASCGAPATDASVWFSYKAAVDGGVVVDVSASDYSAGVIVATVSANGFQLVACGPLTVAFPAHAGTRYLILAFDDQGNGTGNGGELHITLSAAPPPPTFDFRIDKVARFVPEKGAVVVTGLFTCTNADYVVISGQLTERRDGFNSIGFFGFNSTVCDGSIQPIRKQFRARFGRFSPGNAGLVSLGFACGHLECHVGFVHQRVVVTSP